MMVDAMYQWYSAHLGPLTCRCYEGQTAQIVVEYPGREMAVSYSHSSYRGI